MKRWLKSYCAFTPTYYRTALLLIPAVLCPALLVLFTPLSWFLGCLTFVVLLMALEIVLDNRGFGGVGQRDGKQFEYLKSSDRGLQLLKSALTCNLVRMILEFEILLLICAAVGLTHGEGMGGMNLILFCTEFGLLTYFIVNVMLIITRFFGSILLNVGCAGAAYYLLTPGLWLIVRFQWMLPVLAVLCAAVSVLEVAIILHQAKESYYDKAD